MNNHQITIEEKKELKLRIMNSIDTYKNKRRRWLYVMYVLGVACSLLIVFFMLYSYMDTDEVHGIEAYALQQNEKYKQYAGVEEVNIFASSNKVCKMPFNNPTIHLGQNKTEIISGHQKIIFDDASTYNTLVVPYGKSATLELTDKSKIYVNAGAIIVYTNFLNNQDKALREIKLIEGEAIFDITRDAQRPFKVYIKDQEVKVLGTIFNIRNYKEEGNILITLKTGSIQLTTHREYLKKADTMMIQPGITAIYHKDKKNIAIVTENIDKIFAWQQGFLYADHSSLSFIMQQISRYYNVKIELPADGLGEKTFSGTLFLRKGLDNVMHILQTAGNFKYTRINKTVVIQAL